MPRSHWKGQISFGLVSIPIVLFSAEEPASVISFRQINKKTGARIKYKRVDVETEKEVPWKEIGKGYEYEKDVILPVGDDELKRVAGENAHAIVIEEFVDKKNLTLINIDKTYYIVPDKKGEKGYVILREALKSTNKIGIAKVIITTKEYLAAVSIFENALVLHLLHYEDELRKMDELNIPAIDIKKYKVTNREIDIAKKLINSMSGKWKPQKYKDEYKIAVEKWVKAKAHHLPETKMKQRSELKRSGKNIDFVDLLKQSLTKPAKKKTETIKTKKKIKHIPKSSRGVNRKSLH